MSDLTDPDAVDLTRDPQRDGDVRRERWWQDLTGLPPPDGDTEDSDEPDDG